MKQLYSSQCKNCKTLRRIQQRNILTTLPEGETNVHGEAPRNSGDGLSQVTLIKAVCLPANHSATLPVQITHVNGTVLLEPSKSLDQSLQVEESLFEVKEDGSTAVIIVNNSNSSYQLRKSLKSD